MTTRSIPLDQLRTILEHKFQFRHIKNAKDAKGFFVKLERCPLPIYTDFVEYNGADLMEMLGKLDEWEKKIAQCREGLYDMIDRQIKVQQGQPVPAILMRRVDPPQEQPKPQEQRQERQGRNNRPQVRQEPEERQPLSNENRQPEFNIPSRGQQPHQRRYPLRGFKPERPDRDGNK